MDAGNLLKPLLARGELRCVGATTLDEYRQYIEKAPKLCRLAKGTHLNVGRVPAVASVVATPGPCFGATLSAGSGAGVLWQVLDWSQKRMQKESII